MVATCLPWTRAIESSVVVGLREPPFSSLTFDSSGQLYVSPT